MQKVVLTNGQEVETGCYVDGHWGQYGTARVVEIATDLGWDSPSDLELASRHMASSGPSMEPDITPDEFESLDGASDDAEVYLNSITPAGYSWGWSGGELFLWPDHAWAESVDSYVWQLDPCECSDCQPITLNFPGFPPIKGVGPAIVEIPPES